MVDDLVRTVDILPTVLEAIGAPLPGRLDGTTLLPAIGGELVELDWAYGESGRSFMGVDPERHLPGVEGKHRMIRTADWKLVYKPAADGGRYTLFDLSSDPAEQVDVAAGSPGVLAPLRRRLDAVVVAEKRDPHDQPLSPAEVERLHELGYVQ